jgi:Nitroreductase family
MSRESAWSRAAQRRVAELGSVKHSAAEAFLERVSGDLADVPIWRSIVSRSCKPVMRPSQSAVTLDVGHLSETLPILATEFGLGAFVTAAINEADIEQTLGLEPMQESPLAVCGFGWCAAERSSNGV